ncbi:hypothetical protein V6N13_057193 [Hibiscus sabdariffa]
MDASVPVGSPSEGPPAKLDSTKAPSPASDSVAPSVAPTPSVQAAAMAKDIPHDPLVHPEATSAVEEAFGSEVFRKVRFLLLQEGPETFREGSETFS